jgi:hypothetical protein
VWRRAAQSGVSRIEAMQGLGETYDGSITHDAGDVDQIPLDPIVIEDVE